MERGWKPNVEFSPNCPRCGSSNTKFCYYNNYSLTQPRYFCKGCRRYWTKGGSLRNVPVGGGCRKNRRAKSLRLSTDAVSSKNLSYVSSSNQEIGNSFGQSNGNSLVDSTSTSVGHEGGSHIDLALVYANFLNQQPESKSNGDEISELPCNNFDQMPQEFTSLSNTNIQDSSCIQLLEDNAQAAGFLGLSDRFGETHFSESCDHLYFNGFESLNKGQDRFQHPPTSGAETSYALPPLPGEDLASQDTVWSSQLMVSHNPVQPTQLPVLAPDAQDTNLLLGNWNPFDLSSDHTFSGN